METCAATSFIALALSLIILSFLALTVSAQGAEYQPSRLTPPQPPREFRAAWVATVGNIDWPSRPGLTTVQQQAELLALLDRVVQLKLNAVVFQVRPACDAMYASSLEPWSEYLTGTMGQAPEPFYDPLEFALRQAHQRGLELHAWFNPYRAHHSSGKSPVASNHVSRTHPNLVRSYGRQLWLDPGDKAVQDYSLAVVMDVVKRYDIDGVHFDDYFYPYKETDASGEKLSFPDEASWRRFGSGGKLNRDDWRRENVNVFIQRTYASIKAAKPWVKFGISPFGIWRPGVPPAIDPKALDPFVELYADSRKWLANGWLDYFAPQLYWAIEPKEHGFRILLNWWAHQNPKKRHLWPGMDATKVDRRWQPEEILNQIRATRLQPGASGHIHWNMKSLLRSNGLAESLERTLYAQPALVPASPWLSRQAPGKPALTTAGNPGTTVLNWSPAPFDSVSVWVWQEHRGKQWSLEILPASRRSRFLAAPLPDAVAVTAVNRCGILSPPAVVEWSGKPR